MTEQLRIDRKQQQHNQHVVAGCEGSREDYEQLFVHIPNHTPVMAPPKMPKQIWESSYKIEFLEFNGSLKHEEFVNWINQVEGIFNCYEVPESKKLKLIPMELMKSFILVGATPNLKIKKG